MAVLPFRPTPFFANKNQAFWRLQAVGWGGAFLLRAMSSLANDQPLTFLVLVLIATITGFSISLLLAVLYRQLISRRPFVTWGITGLVLPFAVGLYAFIDAWVIGLYRPESEVSFPQLFIGVFYLDATLLVSWSALYYAINFFLQVEEQNDLLIRLENQATSAQLAMLRYQLNPHFLFNTLNAISTLVLDGQNRIANLAVSRLSEFLRYTLDQDPMKKVTLRQELDALNLYLGIEKLRFGDRLKLEFDVDERSETALVPSLLLQPLVENAMKYAIAPREEGGSVTVIAGIEGSLLRLAVVDDGPGLPVGSTGGNGRGVGLRNTRERLQVLYGDAHRIEIADAGPGLRVEMRLPLEI